jgi:hypothetical protein
MLQKNTYKLIEEINDYSFFSKVNESLNQNCKKLTSLGDAVQYSTEDNWESLRYAFWNRLNNIEKKLNLPLERNWNKTNASEAVKLLHPAKSRITQFFSENKLWDQLAGDVWVHLAGAVRETEIDDLVPPLFFSPVLLPVYRAGHYACGWDGRGLTLKEIQGNIDSLPPGKLIVY